MNRHKDGIYSQALYFLGDHREAEDVTQEVLIRAWENIAKIRKRSARTWLMRVTHNLCIDYVRRAKSGGRAIKSEDMSILEGRAASSLRESDPEQLLVDVELSDRILSALRQLPESLRSVMILREIQDMRYEEISRALDIPLNTVKVYIHRGRQELQRALRPSYLERKP